MAATFRDDDVLERDLGVARLVLDGSRPFLVLVRPREGADPLATLVRAEASYLIAEPDAPADALRAVVRAVATAGSAAYGAFLIIELWAGAGRFRILGPDGPAPGTVETLVAELRELDVGHRRPDVVVEATDARHPPGLEPVLSIPECHELGFLLIGIEVPSIYRDPDTGAVYPLFLRHFGRGLSRVLRGAVFEFLRVQTGAELPSYRALGRRRLGATVWEADRCLAGIDASFDLLLAVAPVDADRAWERFVAAGHDAEPELHYRLLPVDPELLKRRLYAIRMEDIDDPSAAAMLREKREEMDRQISLLVERNTSDFVHGSIRLYGHVDTSLLDRARDILARIPPSPPRGLAGRVGAGEFAALARAEFDHYRSIYPAFRSQVQLRPDLVGLMVSSGRLLIGRRLALRPGRVEALLQHEVGTHVLTYVNGAAQPFLQLSRGLARYDELQEGLGVLAEYLVGGLSPGRLRRLAARVVACHCRIEGAAFLETFRSLHREHGFSSRAAYDITTRVYQSGGFTRDLIYLRGFLGLVDHLRAGGELEPLYVGKIAARHLDLMREFRERGVLRPVPLLPRFLDRDDVQQRLRDLRGGLALHNMVAPAGDG